MHTESSLLEPHLPLLIALIAIYGCATGFAQEESAKSFQAHSAAVNCAVYSGDQRYVVTGGADQLVKIWDAQTGEPVRELAGHTGQVLSVAISPDDAVIVSAAGDNTLRMWDVPRPEPLRTFTKFTNAARDVAVSPDGKWAVSVGDGMAARMWNMETGNGSFVLDGHTAATVAAAVRNDNAQIATADSTGEIRFWNPLDGAPQAKLGAHAGPVRRMIYHPNNQQLVSVGDDGQLKVWQLPTPAPRPLAGHTTPVRAVVFSSDGQSTFTASDDGVRAFSTANGALARDFDGVVGSPSTLAISRNNAMVAAAGDAGMIKFWNAADGADRLSIEGHADAIHSIAFHPDNARIASAGEDGTIRLWQLPTPTVPLTGHAGDVVDLAFSPNGQLAASAGSDKTVRAWNPATGQALWQSAAGEQPLTKLAFRFDSTQLAHGDAGGIVQLRSAADGAIQASLGAHAGAVRGLAYHPGGESLATVGDDHSLKVWKLPLPPMLPLAGNVENVNAVALTSDDKAIITGGADKAIRIYDSADGNLLRQLADVSDVVTTLAISRDDALTVAGHAGGAIKLWNNGDGSVWKGSNEAQPAATDGAVDAVAPAELLGHDSAVLDVAFNPTSPTIVSTGADGTLRIWQRPRTARLIAADAGPTSAFVVSPDGKTAAVAGAQQGRPAVFLRDLESGKTVQTLLAHEAAVNSVAFSADGKLLASGGADNTARAWNLADPKFPEMQKCVHTSPVTAVAISSDGTQLYSAAGDNVIRCWNLADGSEVRSISGHSGVIVHLTIRGTTLFSASADGSVRLWNTTDGAAIRSLAHGAAVACLDVDSAGKTIASGGADKNVKLWNASDGAALASLTGHADAIVDLRFNADATQLVSISNTGLWLWDVPGKRRRESFTLAVGDQHGVGFRESQLLAAAADGSIRVITPHLLRLIDAHAGEVVALQLTLDGKQAVTSGVDKTVKLWNLADGELLATFAGPTDIVHDLAVTPDGKHLLAGGLDKILRVWAIPAAAQQQPVAVEQQWEMPAPITSLQISSARARVAIGGEDNIVRVWDWTIGRELQRFTHHAAPVLDVAISADGSAVVSASADKTVHRSTLALAHIAVLEHQPNDVAYTADGSQMILASDLPQLTLWEIGESGLAAKGTLPAANSKPEGLVAAPQQALAIRSDGMQLASLDSEGRANVWNVGDGSLAFVAAPEAIPATTDAPATKPGAGGLEFSADGGKLLIGHGRRLQVIDAKTGRFLQGYDEPTEIACAAFAPDNTTLAVGRRSTQENAAQECAALRQFSLQRLIPAHAGQVAALAFTPDGAGLLSGGADHQVRLWNVADGAPLRSYPGSEAEVTSVAVTQDGERVLAGGLDKKIRIWPFALPATEGEPAAGVTPTATFELASTIHSISTSADNTRLAAATDDGVVSVLDLSTGVDLQRFSAAAQPALAVAFAPDSRALVSGGADNVATVWTMSLVRNIAAQAGPIHDLALAAGGSQAVTAGATGVQHWNLADGNLLRKFNAEEGEFLTVAVRGDNQQLIAADADNRLVFWNLAGGEPTAIVELAAAARLARYSPDNQKIVVACADDHLRFFNPTDGKPTYELTSDTPLAGLTFAADNRTVLTAGNELRQWLYASPTAIRTLTGHGGSVYSVTYSQDGRWIASTSADQTVRIWDASTGAQAKQLSGHQGGVYSASFSPDGALLVSCGADKSIRLWDTLGGRQLKQIPVSNDSLYSVTFFPDGKRVAAAGLERKLYFVDALTGKTETTLDKHSDYVYRVAFNRSGSRVLTCGYGGNIMIWNAANGQQLHEENVHQVSNFADFSPDGARVIVAGGDGKAYFLDLPANVK